MKVLLRDPTRTEAQVEHVTGISVPLRFDIRRLLWDIPILILAYALFLGPDVRMFRIVIWSTDKHRPPQAKDKPDLRGCG